MHYMLTINVQCLKLRFKYLGYKLLESLVQVLQLPSYVNRYKTTLNIVNFSALFNRKRLSNFHMIHNVTVGLKKSS
jgi:hypothetical protein